MQAVAAPEVASHWDVQALGFTLKRSTAPRLTLRVEHIEPPSPN